MLGEVTLPGQYPYVANMTVENAVAIAGGFTPRASSSTIEISRQDEGGLTEKRVVLAATIRSAPATPSRSPNAGSDACPSCARTPAEFVHVLRAPVGGLFRQSLDLARGQAARGHQVGIVATARPAARARKRHSRALALSSRSA